MNSIFSINSLGSCADVETLRNEAISLSDFGTRSLWLHILNYIAFPGREWVAAAAQFSIEEEYQRSVEISLWNLDQQPNHVPVLIWSGQPPFGDIAEIEGQARSAGLRRLAESDRDGIWIMTGVGPCAKLWVLLRSRPYELLAIWPRNFVEEPNFEHASDNSPTDYMERSWNEFAQGYYKKAGNSYCEDIGEHVNTGMELDFPAYRRQFCEKEGEERGDGYLDVKGNMAAYEDMFELVRSNPYPTNELVQSLIC
ncbi:hypothetical protein PWT90_05326 [Aphanocladium album]|nr:hypothetical protein PWT90_05326 [Aphanocladium album]